MANQRLLKPLTQKTREDLVRLYQRTSAAIRSYSRTLTRNEADAEDLTQETYYRLCKTGGDKLTDIPFSYLRNTTRNTHLNQCRDEKLQLVAITETTIEHDETSARSADLVDLASLERYRQEQEEERRKEHLQQFNGSLKIAFAELTEGEKKLIILRLVDELSYEEIAEQIGQPRNQVAYETSLAKKKLQYWFKLYVRRASVDAG